MIVKKIISMGAGLALLTGTAFAAPALAQTNTSSTDHPGPSWQGGQGQSGYRMGGPGMMKPAVFGTVTGVNGNIITMNGKQGFGSTTASVTYTVDATNATVKKNNATSTVSSIAVGDTIVAQGTITGTNVVATSIRDGVMMRTGGPGMPGQRPGGGPGTASSTPILGNGQPVIAGTVSAITGSSLTITTASNVTYTVDASNAKVLSGQTPSSLSSVAVGNKVVIQGTVNGTSIAASTVIDQSLTATGPGATKGPARGFFASISQFFTHIFGF